MASAPEKFRRKRAAEVELPIPGEDGTKLVISIRRLHRADLFRVGQSLRGMGSIEINDPNREIEIGLAILAGERRLVEACVVEPRITFGEEPEDGAAWWEDFPERNRRALLDAIHALHGEGPSPDRGVAERAATFLADEAGAGDGRRPDPARAGEREAPAPADGVEAVGG